MRRVKPNKGYVEDAFSGRWNDVEGNAKKSAKSTDTISGVGFASTILYFEESLF